MNDGCKLNKFQFESLEYPYVSCKKGLVPHVICLAECEAREVVDRCDCVDMYMPPSVQGQ